jgi:hypothetical protein
VHDPGTYLAGVYNRLTTRVTQTIEDEHLVNAPNWLPLRFSFADWPWLSPDSPELIEYRQELDMRRAILTRFMRFSDDQGRVTQVTSDRIVSQAARHLAATCTTFQAENWSGPVRVQSSLDGGVRNAGVVAYAGLADHHLEAAGTTDPGSCRRPRGHDARWAHVPVRPAPAQSWRGTGDPQICVSRAAPGRAGPLQSQKGSFGPPALDSPLRRLSRRTWGSI